MFVFLSFRDAIQQLRGISGIFTDAKYSKDPIIKQRGRDITYLVYLQGRMDPSEETTSTRAILSDRQRERVIAVREA